MSCLNFQRALVIGFLLWAILVLTGCSLNPLDALSGKPEVTAQVGAENVKQTVGLTAKQDTSSKQETTIKESKVDKVDTSNKKRVSASSIQAETITADKIEISNRESDLYVTLFAIACMFVAGFISGVLWGSRNKKGA